MRTADHEAVQPPAFQASAPRQRTTEGTPSAPAIESLADQNNIGRNKASPTGEQNFVYFAQTPDRFLSILAPICLLRSRLQCDTDVMLCNVYRCTMTTWRAHNWAGSELRMTGLLGLDG